VESRIESAVEQFKSGFNCAQAIVGTYAPLQHVCGALTGAFMIAGCKEGTSIPGDKAAKERTYTLVQRMSRQFEKEHGATSCRDLTGCDMNTEEGMRDFHDREVNVRVCRQCVRTAARMIEERVLTENVNP
jgi:C_GCAxxG_C_C family probable redox protein